jgi:hypothetical protein
MVCRLNGVSVFDVVASRMVIGKERRRGKTKRCNCIYWADVFGLLMFRDDRKGVVVKREEDVVIIGGYSGKA